MFFSLEPQSGIITWSAEMYMGKCFHKSLSKVLIFSPRKDLTQDNLIKVVLEHSQKTSNEKIPFSHPESLCTIRIICAQGVRKLCFHTKHSLTILLLELEKHWKFLYKWISRARLAGGNNSWKKNFFFLCFECCPNYGGTLRFSLPYCLKLLNL